MKYYKIWLHVEEITETKKNGEDFKSLDDEFMPLSIATVKKKQAVQSTLDFFEDIGRVLNEKQNKEPTNSRF